MKKLNVIEMSVEDMQCVNGGHTGDATTCPECKNLLPGTEACKNQGILAAVQTYAVMAYCWINS